MSARKVDAGLWAPPQKRAFEVNSFAPQRIQDRKPLPWAVDPRNPVSHKLTACPVCGRVRQYNPAIEAIICNVCELVWYRGRKYRMRDWERKWQRKLRKNALGLPRKE